MNFNFSTWANAAYVTNFFAKLLAIPAMIVIWLMAVPGGDEQIMAVYYLWAEIHQFFYVSLYWGGPVLFIAGAYMGEKMSTTTNLLFGADMLFGFASIILVMYYATILKLWYEGEANSFLRIIENKDNKG